MCSVAIYYLIRMLRRLEKLQIWVFFSWMRGSCGFFSPWSLNYYSGTLIHIFEASKRNNELSHEEINYKGGVSIVTVKNYMPSYAGLTINRVHDKNKTICFCIYIYINHSLLIS